MKRRCGGDGRSIVILTVSIRGVEEEGEMPEPSGSTGVKGETGKQVREARETSGDAAGESFPRNKSNLKGLMDESSEIWETSSRCRAVPTRPK